LIDTTASTIAIHTNSSLRPFPYEDYCFRLTWFARPGDVHFFDEAICAACIRDTLPQCSCTAGQA